MAEYSRFAKGNFTSTGAKQTIYLPFQPTNVRFTNYTVANTAATSQNIASAVWDVSMGQGTAVIQGYNATPALIFDTVTANGISSFSAALGQQLGPTVLLGASGGITKAAAGVVTTTAAHGLSTGDVVVFSNLYQTSSTGMPQICGIPFQVTVTGSTTFVIPWNTNTSNYTAISTGGLNTLASFKKVLYPDLYAPGETVITSVTLGATTTIVSTTPHNLVVGQAVGFRIPAAWGTTELNSLPNNVIPGSPIYGFVTAVSNSRQVIVNINSASYTAFNTNVSVAGTPGRSFPQMVAVGDVNTGAAVYAGGAFYPSPTVNGVSTINGPAIQGAFLSNTRQGFTIGAGVGTVLTTGSLVGAASDVIYWEAWLPDYS